jgi:hypothetical protein
MSPAEMFSTWAPAAAIWSPWAKPVLFAHLKELPDRLVEPLLSDLSIVWAPPADGKSAAVLDLPGALAVTYGLTLAQAGYRPVPLYNAAPGPAGLAVVKAWEIVRAVAEGSKVLAGLSLPADAPPAFLLDANRRFGEGVAAPGRFDNRSISFPTDFPSANFLLSRGIQRVLLVQESGSQPQPDLSHTLRRWQDGGIEIELKQLAVEGPPLACMVKRASLYRWMWHRLLAGWGLRRNALGGFGGILPEASAG